MKESYKNRRLSYDEVLKVMGKQESVIIEAVSNGVNNFYDIKVLTGMNEHSIKRALSNLSSELIKDESGVYIHNCKRVLKNYMPKNDKGEKMPFKNPDSGRTISSFKVLTENEYNAFHFKQQISINYN